MRKCHFSCVHIMIWLLCNYLIYQMYILFLSFELWKPPNIGRMSKWYLTLDKIDESSAHLLNVVIIHWHRTEGDGMPTAQESPLHCSSEVGGVLGPDIPVPYIIWSPSHTRIFACRCNSLLWDTHFHTPPFKYLKIKVISTKIAYFPFLTCCFFTHILYIY